MKKIIFTLGALALLATGLRAQNCEVPVAIVVDAPDDLPAASARQIESALTRALTVEGIAADTYDATFALVARIDILDKAMAATAPAMISQRLGLTLTLGNQADRKKIATQYIELTGAGTNATKAYNNALRSLTPKNQQIAAFARTGKQKAFEYYDQNATHILAEAERLVAQQQYGEALALTCGIPTCSRYGDKAAALGRQIYAKQLNRLNEALLNRARALWAAGQDADAAYEAALLLAAIDPDAACYAEAGTLMKEIRTQMRSDKDFETREKYRTEMNLRQKGIEAWQAVGTAYGRGQQPTTTNLMWMR